MLLGMHCKNGQIERAINMAKLETEVKITESNKWDDYHSPSVKNVDSFKAESNKPYAKYLDHTYKVVTRPDGSAFLFTTSKATGKTYQQYFREAKDARQEAGRLRASAKARALVEWQKDNPKEAKPYIDKEKENRDKLMAGKKAKDDARPKGSAIAIFNEDVKEKQLKRAQEERDRLNGKKKERDDSDMRWVTVDGKHMLVPNK